MRKFAFYMLVQFFLICAHATEVKIKNIHIDGKSAYLVRVGAFPHENNALQLKFKLSSSVQQPMVIDHHKKQNTYFVNIGPLNDLSAAENLQKRLLDDNQVKAIQPTPLQSTLASVQPAYNQVITSQSIDPKPSSPVKEEVKNEDNKVRNLDGKLWNLSGADIKAVIAEVSRVTGKNFIIDPRVQGKISIVSSSPMTDKELYQVFLSMLQISGYAAVPSVGGVIKIVPNIDAKTISPDPYYQLKNPPRGDDMMVAVIPVHFVPSDQLVPVLRPLMPQWSSVSAYAPSNMLILSGRASNIKQMASIIKQVDNSSASGVDVVRLKHALAMDVAATLKDLVKTQSPGGGNHVQTMLAVDDRSNSILLTGSRTERIKLRLLIHRLDKQSSSAFDSNTQVIYLSYLRAEDLVPILAGVAQANFSGNVGTTIGTITLPALDSTNPASSLANGSSSTNTNNQETNNPPTPANPAATPNTSNAATQNESSTKPTVQIIAEPNTNSIIINAPSSLIRILRAVIRQLDIKPAQLLIEALVAEVNESDVKGLGIEWGMARRRLTDNDVTNDAFRPGLAIINSRTSARDFQARIFALATQQKANILSTPSVVVLDNRQAKILVGKQVSVTSTTYPNNAGGTTIGSPYETFNRVNVALHLYVRPQITHGKGIQLQIDQGNDTIDPASTGNTTNPTFDISAIVTAVHVESGDTVVLGGLIQNSLGDNNNKTPIIGDIPGLGRIFQHNIDTHEKRVLMVFIRPVIMRSERDAVEISSGKYNDIRQYELEMLRDEVYNKGNEAMILPPLHQAKLPRPFSQPPRASVAMTK